MTSITMRPATPEDAAAMARFIDMAAEGLPHHLWSGMALPGEDPWAVGAARAARDTGGFSWTNATVLEADRTVVGCLVDYRLPEPPEPFDPAALPPMLVPVLELEALASGSWYVNVLAVAPRWQNRRLGARLLDHAEARGRQAGCTATTLVAADANTTARRFYARQGYREVATRPMVKETWQGHGQHWILLRKP